MKLKENVDLKVLEELGFERFNNIYYRQADSVILLISNNIITQFIQFKDCIKPTEVYNLAVKDLIEKGLVE